MLSTTTTSATAATPDMGGLKGRLKSTWMAGDYDRFSRYMERGTREFFERLDVAPGGHLLDVACGSGQLALMAARDGLHVTGVDIATNLVQRARIRARAEGLSARFEEADAEDLPFANQTFDAITSVFGAMFAPRPELVARELIRVCNPGGIIAMANWTPQGFIGRMFRVISSFIAAPGTPSPLLWGDESTVRQRFSEGVADLRLTRRHFVLDYPFPPAEVVEFFRLYYGPTARAFASLDGAAQKDLRGQLESLWSDDNRAGGGLTQVAAEYLEVVVFRA